jgi:glycerophosphoryl diester phosphodiesterase
MARFAYLEAPTPLAFAHRGGTSRAENTAEAFAHAVALGYRYLETDVHTTRDRVPVAIHDPTLARVAGEPARVADLAWRDLATVRVAGAAAVPRLDDLLHAWPRVRFNIDVKADPAVEPTLAAVTRCGAVDRVLLASFSDRRLDRLRALAGPGVATSLGRAGVARLRLGSWSGRPVRLPASAVAVQVPTRGYGLPVVDRRFVRYAHRLGLQVHVWTINQPEVMHRLLDLGVDGLMTDSLGALREVYLARGCWYPSH